MLLINSFQRVFNHGPGPCKRLPNVVNGSEDACVLPNGLMYISADYGQHPGKILRLDFDSGVADTEEFRIEGKFDAASLSPHGLSAWVDPKSGEVTLFVVNHATAGESVEVFRHDGSKTSKVLKHVKTIACEDSRSLNDLVATGPDSFYATIFYTTSMTLEYLFLYPGGGVLHYDKGETTVVDTGLTMANGINISPDKRFLYVVSAAYRSIVIYRIQDDGSIRREETYDIGTSPDNIHVELDTGDLWVGCHPNSYLTGWHLSYPGADYTAYSQVLRIQMKDGRITSVREVYANDGSEIRGSSIAIPYKKKLFIGTVIEGAALCELVYPG